MPRPRFHRGKHHGISPPFTVDRIDRQGSVFAPSISQAAGTTFGPTSGAQWVRDNAGPRGSITEPVAAHTTMVPANSVTANQTLLTNDATGVIWWPKGTYAMTTTGYSIKAGLVNHLETGPLRTASDTAILDMSGTTTDVVQVAGANVEWHGGIIEGGAWGMRGMPGGVNDNFLIEDAELRYASESNFAGGASDGSNNQVGLTVQYCLFHHGGQHNVHLIYVDNMTYEHNESHDGNANHEEGTPPPDRTPNDEGSVKLLHVSGLVYRYNYSHDNDGSDWFDTNVSNCTIDENVLENNQMTGIFCEANDNVIIQRNYFKDNMLTGPGGDWTYGPYCHNLNISRSDNVEVTLNDFYMTDAVTYLHAGDIMVRYQTGLTGLRVHHNRFSKTFIPSGDDHGGFITMHNSEVQAAYAVSDNTYDYNEYHVLAAQSGADHFHRAGDDDRTWAEWQAGNSAPYAGSSFYDPNGTFTADL